MEDQIKPAVYDVDSALFVCGNGKIYQLKAIIVIALQFMASAFIAAGWDLLFQIPKLICYQSGQPESEFVCTKDQACSGLYKYKFDTTDKLRNITEEYDLVCSPRSNWVSFTNCIFKLGLCLGVLCSGLLMQKHGRIRTMTLMMLIATIFAILGYFSFSIGSFAFFAFCINFGFGGFSVSSMVYISEISSDNLRKIAPSIFMVGWSVGQTLIGIISIYYFEWKKMQLFAMGIPLLILTYCLFQMRESPRFQVLKKQYSQAKDSILYMAKYNNRDIDHNFQFAEQLKYQELKTKIQKLLFDNEFGSSNTKKNYTYLSLFKYSSIRIRTFIILYIWGTISFSYYLTSYEAFKYSKGLRYHIITMGIIELISYLLSANISLQYERVIVIKYTILVIGISHVLFILIPVHKTQYFNLLVFYFLCIIRIAVSGLVSFLNVYIQEVYPTSMRHFAFGLTSFWEKIVWVFIPFYSQLCYDLKVSPLVLVGIFVLAGLWMIYKLRETLNKPIQENVEEEQDDLLNNEFF